MNTRESDLRIARMTWLSLVWQLRRRGGGGRESGAFLLGPRMGGRVSSFVCYDDLDPRSLDTGIIRFDGRGYVPLWKRCRELSLKVVADVHTHPNSWTNQSEADRAHPMVAQAGHLALILPHYSQHSWFGPKGAGFFRYLGDGHWESLPIKRLKITHL